MGISFNDNMISMLLYADDIALIADSELNLQKMLDHLHEWCGKWKLKGNCLETKVVHFRKPQKPCTTYSFHLGDNQIETVSHYKYLGNTLDQFLNYKTNA